jgi:magnesium transporter
VIVDCAIYENGVRRAEELPLEAVHEASSGPNTFAWIGLVEPDAEEFESVRREFGLHELAVEDAIKAHQRPKLETYGDSLFLVLKTARWLEAEEELQLGEVLLFVGKDFIVSVRHGESDLHAVRLRMEQRPDLLRCGPAAAMYAIVDRIVDDYEPVVVGLDAAIREVESEVFTPSQPSPGARIYHLKREVLDLEAAATPLVEPIESLTRTHADRIPAELQPYFRDVHDHLLRLTGHVAAFREVLNGVLTADLSRVSLRLNQDVRRISAWAAIIAVPTMIAGIYGMNFRHMPELGWRFGYPLILAVIALACFMLYRGFRRAGWL